MWRTKSCVFLNKKKKGGINPFFTKVKSLTDVGSWDRHTWWRSNWRIWTIPSPAPICIQFCKVYFLKKCYFQFLEKNIFWIHPVLYKYLLRVTIEYRIQICICMCLTVDTGTNIFAVIVVWLCVWLWVYCYVCTMYYFIVAGEIYIFWYLACLLIFFAWLVGFSKATDVYQAVFLVQHGNGKWWQPSSKKMSLG